MKIETKEQHQQALKEVEKLMNAERNTPEGEELDRLVTLIMDYEKRAFSLEKSGQKTPNGKGK